MFDVGWTELVLIAVVAVVVIGPKDLPRVMRYIGQWTGKMKRMSREFQNQFNEALRETELDSVRKDIEQITKTDPLAGLRKEGNRIGAEIQDSLEKKPGAANPPSMSLVPSDPAAAAAGDAAPKAEADAGAPPPLADATAPAEPSTLPKAAP